MISSLKSLSSFKLWLTFLFSFVITIGLFTSCGDGGSTGLDTKLTIASIRPDSGAVGMRVIIHSNIVSHKLSNNHVTFDGTPAQILNVDPNSLTVEVPKGATSGPVGLKVFGFTTNGPHFTVLKYEPVITSVSPQKGGPSTRVVITGKNFLPGTSSVAMDKGDTQPKNEQSPGKAEIPENKSKSSQIDSVSTGSDTVLKAAKGAKVMRAHNVVISVSFGETLAPIISLSTTQIIVKVPEDPTGSKITIRVGDKKVTSTAFDLLRGPAIDKVTPKAAPVGTSVTITGQNFSATKSENTVTFNGTEATISSASQTKLEVTVPQGATTGVIKVAVNGQTATGPTFTVTDKPVPQVKISSISPKQGPVGTTVTITGENFSSTKSESTVTFNGTKANLKSASKTKLVVTVPQGATDGPVQVQTNGQTATGPSFNVIADPSKQLSIMSISPKQGPVGTQVTIKGNNFSKKKSENTVTFNGTKAAIKSASTTKLVVTVPKGATSGQVKVQVGSQTATGPTFTVTDKPVPQVKISSISPKSGPIGTKVTIQGQHFSKKKSENTVTFNGTKATISSASNTELVVAVPQGVTDGPVEVQVGNQTASGPAFDVTKDPSEQLKITAVNPKKGPVGTKVTIKGQHFNKQKSKNTVTFNGTKAAISSASKTKLVVTVPKGATSGAVKVQVGNQTAMGPTFTVIDKPVPQVTITSISPKAGPVGTSVTIIGENFSTTKAGNTVTFNGMQATISSASATKLVVTVPQDATDGPVKVSVNGQTASGPSFDVTADPSKQLSITSISPKEGPVGTKVTINGQNFSDQKAKDTVTFNGTKAKVTSASTTKLVVTVPKGATTGPVKVQVGNQTASGPTFTVTDKPVPQVSITDISPKSGPVGTKVTISGKNFSSKKSKNTVTFNGTKANISSSSTTKLVVMVPNDATDGPVKVSVNGQTASGSNFDVTADPAKQLSISSISPKSGPIGTSITITGQNFSDQKSENTVTFNSTKAAVSSASTTQLVVKVPADATSGPVKVQVGNQTATGPTFTVTEEPVPQVKVSSINPKKGPVGTKVTIQGQNFSSKKTGNTVTFNGTKATISSASKTKLVVSVPQGATDGPVKVQVGGQTATGPTFTVTENHAPTIVSDAAFSVDENTTAVTTIKATDPDGDALTYSISGGADAAKFTIDTTTGKLAFKTAPDYEAPGDADGDNVYEVQVKAGDGTLSDAQAVKVTVTDVNEAPVITSNSFSADENQTDVGTITATDPEGDGFTYSITGGADQHAFTIEASTGKLIFQSAPDYEAPGDADGDNMYQVEITVSDGSLSDSQAVNVSVTDVNDVAPTITSGASFSVPENTSDSFTTITADDPEGGPLNYSISGGADASRFAIYRSSGALRFFTVPDFEASFIGDANNDGVYEVTVQVSDGSLSGTQALQVTVTDVAEAPEFSRSRILANNSIYYAYDPDFTYEAVPAGTDLALANNLEVAFFERTEPITSATIGGPDAALFSVSRTEDYKVYLTGPTLDFSESPYEFTVTAHNAAGQTTTQTFTIPVSQ